MSEKLLDKINYPSDLRKLKKDQLKKVSDELRSEFKKYEVQCKVDEI